MNKRYENMTKIKNLTLNVQLDLKISTNESVTVCFKYGRFRLCVNQRKNKLCLTKIKKKLGNTPNIIALCR